MVRLEVTKETLQSAPVQFTTEFRRLQLQLRKEIVQQTR
jgi:hypothetical protein